MYWSKDNKPIMASSLMNIKYEPKTGDIDVEFDFVKPVDAGEYKCKAVNIYGQDDTLAVIGILKSPNVDERPQTVKPEAFEKLGRLKSPDGKDPLDDREKAKGKPPKFVIHFPAEVKLHEGVKFKTRCKVKGYPLPKVIFVFFKKEPERLN